VDRSIPFRASVHAIRRDLPASRADDEARDLVGGVLLEGDGRLFCNPLGIICIRAFSGRGIRVWGARITASDALWKYVNVRRLFLFLEESIDEGTQWVVFEPND